MAGQSELYDRVVEWMGRHENDPKATFVMLDADLSGDRSLERLHGHPNSKAIWTELGFILEMFAATGQWTTVLKRMIDAGAGHKPEPPMREIRRIMRERSAN